MYGDKLNVTKMIQNLAALADGCPDHPEYRANEPEKNRCLICQELYKLRGQTETSLSYFPKVRK